ncbi:MAG: Unknown protein [uncultured Sulfurovum sp.]|uniref:Uncharacterized protein n=1 Tax=uncultured Sulfurovum sp. TaxID=269237 RepID=A0A6S6SXQ4_9BACT|nr:MAG: Unknown protein [uncultured Sulfurovum sp.]
MNLSDKSNLLKIAIEEGCKTVRDLAEFIKNNNGQAGTYRQLSV